MFNFLCYGKICKEKIHIVSWASLSIPKNLGGWGLKNMAWFGKALSLKKIFGEVSLVGVFRVRY